jgi:hypothetical protein
MSASLISSQTITENNGKDQGKKGKIQIKTIC